MLADVIHSASSTNGNNWIKQSEKIAAKKHNATTNTTLAIAQSAWYAKRSVSAPYICLLFIINDSRHRNKHIIHVACWRIWPSVAKILINIRILCFCFLFFFCQLAYGLRPRRLPQLAGFGPIRDRALHTCVACGAFGFFIVVIPLCMTSARRRSTNKTELKS